MVCLFILYEKLILIFIPYPAQTLTAAREAGGKLMIKSRRELPGDYSDVSLSFGDIISKKT